jgi:hypothetical protein
VDYDWILQPDFFSSPFHFSVAATMPTIIPFRRNILNSYCVLRYHRVRLCFLCVRYLLIITIFVRTLAGSDSSTSVSLLNSRATP